ncbi:MAG: hypothetical protein Q7T79_03355 [bacterium]|nr:hypothetical protein [bacterium]
MRNYTRFLATTLKKNIGFIMFLKDETRNLTQRNIKIAYSDNLTNPSEKQAIQLQVIIGPKEPQLLKLITNWLFILINIQGEKKYSAIRNLQVVAKIFLNRLVLL